MRFDSYLQCALFWPFTVWTNCSSDLKIFANSQPSSSNFKSFSRSLEQFFLTVGQNNFGNEIPFLIRIVCFYYSTDMNNIATSKKISFHSDRFIQKMDNIVSCPRQELSLTFLQSTIFLWSQQFWPWNLPQTFFSCLQVFFFSVIVAKQLRGHSISTWTRWGGRGSNNRCFCPRLGYKNCPRRGDVKK